MLQLSRSCHDDYSYTLHVRNVIIDFNDLCIRHSSNWKYPFEFISGPLRVMLTYEDLVRLLTEFLRYNAIPDENSTVTLNSLFNNARNLILTQGKQEPVEVEKRVLKQKREIRKVWPGNDFDYDEDEDDA